MKPFAFTLFAALALAAPVSAQSMSVLLPVLSFPETVVVPSTKGCAPQATGSTCQLEE